MTQPQVPACIQLYLPIFEKTLQTQKALAFRQVSTFEMYLVETSINRLYQDGTEKAIPRSTDHETQKEYYSGKKKRHSVKNNIFSDDQARVLFVSDTYEGCVHDKKISQELELTLPKGTQLFQDTCFQEYRPLGEDVLVKMLIKKFRKAFP